MIQSPDPQDSAEYEAWMRQAKINRFDENVEILEEQYIEKKSMRQRCYKGKFQQPKPFTENSGDA